MALQVEGLKFGRGGEIEINRIICEASLILGPPPRNQHPTARTLGNMSRKEQNSQ